MHTTLISTEQLAPHLENPDWAVVDCRFALDDARRGERDYLAAHVPGAVYAHLKEDLSGPVIPGKTGRHPLPAVEACAATFSRWGIDESTQVVCYDDAGGAFASRLWWMLRWLGHDAVAVLDGGWNRWAAENRLTEAGRQQRAPRQFRAVPRVEMAVNTAELQRRLGDPEWTVVDSRAAERYRGEVEPIDAVAGHIPGALNAPHAGNVTESGRFRPAEQLRERFASIVKDQPGKRTVFYCGSGVTACQNLLAWAHAGLGDALLYPGSWSEWSADPNRPVEKG